MTSLKQQIRSIERTVARLKKESKGKYFTSLSSDEIERRLLANDPFITSFGYDGYTVPGGKIEAHFGVYNGTIGSPICLHLWVGSGMVDPWGEKILLNVD